MKIKTYCAFSKNKITIAFIPTIVFSSYMHKKSLSLVFLCFEIEINF